MKTDEMEGFGEGIQDVIDPEVSTHVNTHITLLVQSMKTQNEDEKNINSYSFEN
ncbi:TATA-binding protein-associated factor 172, partial [Araneus ventricosus]